MAIANSNEEKPYIIYTFKKLCNGEQWLAAQHYYIIISLVTADFSYYFVIISLVFFR